MDSPPVHYGWWSRHPTYHDSTTSVWAEIIVSGERTGFRSYLAHESGDDTMEARAPVAKTLLTSAQSTEVLCVDIETLMHEKTEPTFIYKKPI